MTSLKLSNDILDGLNNKIEVPLYLSEPSGDTILHLGVGNFHRSHQAYYLHKLLQKDPSGWNICGAGIMPQDMDMKQALKEQDFLYTLVTREEGWENVSVIGAIRNYIHIPTENDTYTKICVSNKLKIISLTITEKGYCFDNDMNLDLKNKNVQHDLNYNDDFPLTAIGILAFGLRQRMLSGRLPLTVMSCDNIPENGSVLRRILFQYVEQQNDKELLDYLAQFVSFPCTMVDRITPITTEEQKSYLETQYNLIDAVPVYSEGFIQWVVEDDFKSTRPDWEKAGAVFVQDVKPYELMKIRLLNGGHSAMAYLSLLAGYFYVDDAVNDELIRNFVFNYMNEVKQTLNPIKGVDFDEYIEKLLKRFANLDIRDRLLRLAEDGSTKFLNCTIGPLFSLLECGENAFYINTALSAWIVYLKKSLINMDFEVKDPIATELQKSAEKSDEDISAFLSINSIFPKEIFKYQDFMEQLERTVRIISEEGVNSFLKKQQGG